MRHLLNPLDFSVEETGRLLDLAVDIEHHLPEYAHVCDGKKIATLFYEPSTRTRLSFESAMLSLGGSVLGFSSADSSSAAKGESVADTIRIISCYADICAMRHPKEGAPLVAANHSSIPVINAGDGFGQHPSQALLDMYTIVKEKGQPDGLAVALIGDLKYGRTVHSLVDFLKYYKCRLILASPDELKMPESIVSRLQKAGVQVDFKQSIDEAVAEADIVYMTRVQKERFADLAEYEAGTGKIHTKNVR